MFENILNSQWFWLGIIFVSLFVARLITGKWNRVFQLLALLVFFWLLWWLLENAGDIVLKNFLQFPKELWNGICNFFGSFYDPNEGVLENIFYNDWTWIIIFIVLLISTRGQNIFLILGTMFFLWLLGHMIIVALGIEFFFGLVAIIVAFMDFYFRRNRNH